MTNTPCVITKSETATWKSRHDWITSEGLPNFSFLSKQFGTSIVPVAECDNREYNSQHKIEMSFIDYLNHWKNLIQTPEISSENLYLKDWHFQREYPSYEAYKTPKYFHSDWLNEYHERENDDYKFVYMGPKGTWTPLHVDVFGSYSWSANVCGRKKWWMFPPEHEKFLKDETNKLIYLVEDGSASKHRDLCLEVIQEPGEVIFVPSGWHHQVWNIDHTISINHNWFNACNILYVWHCLNVAALDVEKEISDCKTSDDWEEQWQIILKVHHGFNYADFYHLLEYIFEKRVKYLKSLDVDDYSKEWQEMFDIFAIKNVCSKMLNSNLPLKLRKLVEYLFINVENVISKSENK
ncbi:hypothetical protein JTE90_023628 [Oedothorax gibbosus]|uniref:Jumonji domain-containing protein 4 n=1 Tax=Oedothorax gibbosus TaxID=931172 RepID=A0AAV6U1L2_9ARAC|nr:hypothetical protein JTE90_023628 [Oedothorax gibbosus]